MDRPLDLGDELLDSIFKVATELVRGERASLLLKDDESSDFVVARATGMSDDLRRSVRVREGVGISGRVAASQQPLMASNDAQRSGYRTGSFVSVPIIVGNQTRGVLNIADPVDQSAFGQSDLSTLEVLAAHVAACLVRREEGEVLRRLAETDPLTWLFNRRHFDRRLEAEANRARRAEHMLALLMIDVDRFKAINDRYGHSVGDHLLRAVAVALKQAVRLYDVPTRYGGDEFAVLLPEADSEVASRVAQRILERLSAADLPELLDGGEPVSVSIGVATFPRPSPDIGSLVEAADTAMYRAKKSGGGLRVWEHAFANGPRGGAHAAPFDAPTPFLADPSRLATAALQSLVPRSLASEWNAVVVGREGQVLTVAMPRPDPAAVDALSRASGFAIYPVYSNAMGLEATRRRLSGPA